MAERSAEIVRLLLAGYLALGLPVAVAPRLLDADGRAFGRNILPLVADPVSVRGRLVAVGDVLQIRAPSSAAHRL